MSSTTKDQGLGKVEKKQCSVKVLVARFATEGNFGKSFESGSRSSVKFRKMV